LPSACDRNRILLVAPACRIPGCYGIALAGFRGVLGGGDCGTHLNIALISMSIVMDPASERGAVLAQLEHAANLLKQSMNPKLVPPAGAQIGYAIRGARDKEGVASVEGRIAGTPGTLNAGPCSFGADEEMARVILTIMKFDPRRRSAALLRFSDRALDVLDGDLFLECVSYDGSKIRSGISTMDWGIASCCKNEVPDVIYPENDRSPGAVLVILGEEPAGVANNIIICSNRI